MAEGSEGVQSEAGRHIRVVETRPMEIVYSREGDREMQAPRRYFANVLGRAVKEMSEPRQQWMRHSR